MIMLKGLLFRDALKRLAMPAKDIYHETVKNALIKDGWTITHDPLVLRWGTTDVYVDLGAEQLLAAEKRGQKIAVEIKSFVGRSDVDDLEKALGQYLLYHDILTQREPDRICVPGCARRRMAWYLCRANWQIAAGQSAHQVTCVR